MEEYMKVCQGIFIVSSSCGFLCVIALLILLFLIPNGFAADSHDAPDNSGESLQAGQILDMNWSVTVLLILAALHAILIPWSFVLTKESFARIIFASYPFFEITWFVLFRKTLFAEKFRETPVFKPVRIICVIDLIPITLAAVLSIPVSLLEFFLSTFLRIVISLFS